MLWIVLSLFKEGVAFSGYFLIAHSFYLIFAIVAILFYNAFLPLNSFTVYALGNGTLIEAFVLGFLISYRIRQLEEKHKIYNMQLTIDKMTALHNKSYFEEVFDEEIAYIRETGEGFAMMILDIDFFKQYNDTYGHLEGDKALAAVSGVLKKKSEKINRYGIQDRRRRICDPDRNADKRSLCYGTKNTTGCKGIAYSP